MDINNKEMKISIIIPVYNVAPYVEECIQSVLNQDYEDMEVIIVDDCGTDNSMELVRKTIAGTSKEIHILKHDYNRGFAVARNTGIGQAVGDYIFFLDSDDYIEPDCISSLVKVARTHANPDLVTGSSKDIHGNKTFGDISDCTGLKEYYENNTHIKKMMLNFVVFPCNVWNRLINREWLLKNKLFFKEGMSHDDLLWILHAAKYVKSMAILKKTTHHYRYNPNGCMATIQRKKHIEDYNAIIKDCIVHLDFRSLPAQLLAIYHLANMGFVARFGGLGRPVCIRIFYPLIYLGFFFMKQIGQAITGNTRKRL